MSHVVSMPVASTAYVPMPNQQVAGYQYGPVVPGTAVAATPLLVDIHAPPPPPSRRGRALPACILLIALVFAIVAVATSSILHLKAVDPKSGAASTLEYGPFRVCYNAGQNVPGVDSIHGCTLIDAKCQFNVTVVEDVTTTFDAVEKCDIWNRARGFLVTSVVGLGFAFLVQLLAICMNASNKCPKVFVTVLTFIGYTCGLVAMAIYIWERKNDPKLQEQNSDDPTQPQTTVEWSYGFGLLCASWIVAFLTTCCTVRIG